MDLGLPARDGAHGCKYETDSGPHKQEKGLRAFSVGAILKTGGHQKTGEHYFWPSEQKLNYYNGL